MQEISLSIRTLVSELLDHENQTKTWKKLGQIFMCFEIGILNLSENL